MAKAAKKAVKQEVAAEKTGTDIFTRVVELKGNSVFVRGNETVYNSPVEAAAAFDATLNKTVW